jgi:ABC-type Na+ efflux pump permease subunit
MSKAQIVSLIKQELRRATRSKYVWTSFILLPLLMWAGQGALQAFIQGSIAAPEVDMIYTRNFDAGVGEIQLGEQFIAALQGQATLNSSLIAGVTINSTRYSDTSYNDLIALINTPETMSEALPLIIIPENFTATHLALNFTSDPLIPVIEIFSPPSRGYWDPISPAIQLIIAQPPFTISTIEKTIGVNQTAITIEGEESAFSFGIGLMAFFGAMLAAQAPGPFINSSFAGEREKRTMESLLVLPISRFSILLGKVIAGTILLALFAVMNFVGVAVFSTLIGTTNTFLAFESSLTLYVLVAGTMFLLAFVNVGIGISTASLAKDVRTAESMFGLLTIGSMVVGAIALVGGLPELVLGDIGIILYLVPWTNGIALLMKGAFPLTFASATLTGSMATDMLLHLGYMVGFIAICLFIASKIFDRESIIA